MIRGLGANITRLRAKYQETTGRRWHGTDHLLREITRQCSRVDEVLARMAHHDKAELPDDPKLRPLGLVSDADLLAEIAKRPKLLAARESSR